MDVVGTALAAKNEPPMEGSFAMPSKVLLLVLIGFAVLLTGCAQRLTTQDDQGFVYDEPKCPASLSS
jgi:hypothetical protein